MPASDIRIEAWFDRPRAVVFAAWTTPDVVATWFAVQPWTVTEVQMTARAGENWRVDFRHPDGREYREEGTFKEVSVPDRLVFTLRQIGLGGLSPVTTITVTFDEQPGGTRVAFVQSGFEDPDQRAGNADGWSGCFQRLREMLAR